MNTFELYKVADEKGIAVDAFDFRKAPSLAIKETNGAYSIVLDYDTIANEIRERVHLAHCLGHCEADAFYMPNVSKAERGRKEYLN